jgi:tetratricopeptide (TPR) repeat protein
MNELALTLIERGNLDASEKLLRRALEVRVDSGAILEEALLYKNLAGLQIKRADLEEAERLCRESLRIYRSLSPRPTAYEARALATLGFVLAEQGKARDALEAFRQASKLLKECLGSKHYAVVEIDRNILAVYRLLGRSREAERLLEDVIQRTPHALQDSHADVIQDLSSLGGFLLERGDYPGAVSYLRDGLGRLERRSGPLPSVEANLKQNLGVALLNWSTARQGAPAGADRVQMQDEALQLLKEALRLRRQLRGPAAAATLRDQLAVAFHALGRLAEAERMAKRSVAESIRLHGEDHDRVALPTVNLAGVQASLGKTQEAADSYSRARAILRRHPDSPRWVWVTALEGLASLEIERGDLDRAAGLLREALMLTEVLRWQAGRSVIDRARFSQERGNRELATVLAWVEVLRGQPDAALEALEQGRSRVQLDSLAKPIESRLISLHPMVKSQALTKGLDEAMSAFDRVLDAETTPQRLLDRNAVGSRRTQQQEKASAAREQLDRALRDWTESLRRLWPGTMPQKLKSLQEALEPGEKILYLSQAMEGVSLCLLGETGPGQAAIVAEGQQEVDQLLRLVGVVAEELQTRKTGRSGLHKLSLRPLALELFPDEVRLALVAARRVVVITDPAFEGIPFQLLLTCLPRGKGEEGEQTEPVGVSYGPDVVYAASGSVYLHCRERAAIKREQKISELSAVLLGDPVNSELKDSGPEVEHLSALLRRQGWSCVPLLREKATLVQLEEVVAGSRLLHFSSHGHQSTGGSPYLELTPSESKQGDPVPDHLTLTRLFGHWRGLLDRCELVTLAACESGRGEPLGDSVLSLPWGFFYAGADTVVASLWKVHDAATRLLMERFYQNLLGSFDKPRVVCGERYAAHRPMPKVRALREAKEWLRVRTSEENRLALETLRERSDGTRNQPDEETATLLVPTGSSFKDRYDFSHPYFWAAFVLIGNPD